MTWTQQRQLVKSLSDRAQNKRRKARHIRGNLKAWMTSYLGSVETVVWLFAAGSFWAAGRSSPVESGSARRSIMAVIHTSFLAWQLVHRQLEIALPAAGNPPEDPR